MKVIEIMRRAEPLAWAFVAGCLFGWGVSDFVRPDCPRQQVRHIEVQPTLLKDCQIVSPGECILVDPYTLQQAAISRLARLCV